MMEQPPAAVAPAAAEKRQVTPSARVKEAATVGAALTAPGTQNKKVKGTKRKGKPKETAEITAAEGSADAAPGEASEAKKKAKAENMKKETVCKYLLAEQKPGPVEDLKGHAFLQMTIQIELVPPTSKVPAITIVPGTTVRAWSSVKPEMKNSYVVYRIQKGKHARYWTLLVRHKEQPHLEKIPAAEVFAVEATDPATTFDERRIFLERLDEDGAAKTKQEQMERKLHATSVKKAKTYKAVVGQPEASLASSALTKAQLEVLRLQLQGDLQDLKADWGETKHDFELVVTKLESACEAMHAESVRLADLTKLVVQLGMSSK